MDQYRNVKFKLAGTSLATLAEGRACHLLADDFGIHKPELMQRLDNVRADQLGTGGDAFVDVEQPDDSQLQRRAGLRVVGLSSRRFVESLKDCLNGFDGVVVEKMSSELVRSSMAMRAMSPPRISLKTRAASGALAC